MRLPLHEAGSVGSIAAVVPVATVVVAGFVTSVLGLEFRGC